MYCIVNGYLTSIAAKKVALTATYFPLFPRWKQRGRHCAGSPAFYPRRDALSHWCSSAQVEVAFVQILDIHTFQTDRGVPRLNDRETVFLAQKNIIKGQVILGQSTKCVVRIDHKV